MTPQKLEAAVGQTPLSTVLSNNTNVNGVDRTVPDGLDNISTWFNVPTINNNNTKILTPGTGGNQGSADVIQLTQYQLLANTAKLGVIWSKRDQTETYNQNFIDINKKQTMSMWMFFGGAHSYGGADTGDGMAFVLQNSTKADNAFTTIPSTGFVGESLGVWGSESKITDASSTVANRAIDNSWALEFDTFPNAQNDVGNNFDHQEGLGYVNNHIGSNYPGEPATYLTDKDGKVGMILNHMNLITSVKGATYPTNFLTDDRWHHVTMTWTPASSGSTIANMNLKYDDKKIDGTVTTPSIDQNSSIDLTKFNLNGGNKLYWGFTGSTGGSTENNLIIFESIPAIVEADAGSTMYDESSQRYIEDATTEDPNRNVVYDGDKVDINYNLKYLSGSQDWKSIVADMKLPEKIDYSDAEITYTDASGKTITETISELNGMTNNEVTHALAQSLSLSKYVSAKITFKGTVNNGSDTTDSNVAAEHASFDGTNLQKDTMTQAFIVKHTAKLNLAVYGKDTLTAVLGNDVNLQAQASYSDGTTIDPSDYEVHTVVNNSSETSISDMDANPLTFKVPADQIQKGTNTVTMYLVNKKTHIASNTINFTINANDVGLQLQVANESHFKTVQAYPSEKIIGRANDWLVKVIDNRAAGSKWDLTAQATEMSDNFKGNLIFIDKKGDSAQTMTNKLIDIEDGVKSNDVNTDVSSNWSSDTGVLLKQTGLVDAGTYDATVTWTITDSTTE